MAKIAVNAATYWIDRPYSYLVPEEITDRITAGVRVYVPFSRGNKISEGIVLAVSTEPKSDGLKSVVSVIDSYPVITKDQIQLALFMRDRFFCTIYEAVKSMLPVGLWLNESGKTRIQDKYIEFARLEISSEDALELSETKKRKAPMQANILKELSFFGEICLRELLLYTGASRISFNKLVAEGTVSVFLKEKFRRPDVCLGEKKDLPLLNSEQKSAFDGLRLLTNANQSSVSLLQGVTGSGKTTVYIYLIDAVLKDNKDAILLVPEIALTPQMLKTFSSYFGDDIAVLHSSLTAAERYDEWKRIKRGQAHLVIGTRSAIFAPVQNLGIVIIDEEQEDTYKSDISPRYNAEDIAKYLTYKSSCALILGSATPKITTRYYAETEQYHFFRLNNRYNKKDLPAVDIVDMKDELKKGNPSVISSFLKEEIQKNIDNGEQSILFLNRRGSNKLITCGECGYVYQCPNCSVSLTYHSVNNKLICHYCGYSKRVDDKCPKCKGILNYIGAGTQLLEKEVSEFTGNENVLRMDTDVISRKVTHEQLFGKFQAENIPVLIGTQMVTKGLNFDNVTLVGVISADQSLYASDYRASEKTFSLITQVVGRSGRGEKAGRAVIQTFTPKNETIVQAAAQDYDEFYRSEIQMRQLEGAPPFFNFIPITVSGSDESLVLTACRYIKNRLEFLLKSKDNIDILGPAPMSVVKVNNRYRYRVIIRCNTDNEIRKAVALTIIECYKNKKFKKMAFYADNELCD